MSMMISLTGNQSIGFFLHSIQTKFSLRLKVSQRQHRGKDKVKEVGWRDPKLLMVLPKPFPAREAMPSVKDRNSVTSVSGPCLC